MSENRPITFLCLATGFKGFPFIYEAKRQGCRVLMLIAEEHKNEAWPWDMIDERFFMPSLSKEPDVTYAVSYLARTRKIDRIVALDDYDVATVAHLREHLRIPGMGDTTARHFRDKLAMRVQARDEGILVPEFSAVFNYDDLREFMQRVPPPWVLKPRFEAGAIGIKKLHHPDDAWRELDHLGDQQSFYLMEKFVPGNVYHVDSIISEKKVVFSVASQYGAPPLTVSHGGGIFTTRILPPGSEDRRGLMEANKELMKALRMVRGVTHAEFIRGHEDGRFYFLETAARVGGANIDRMVEAATDIVLWAEAARVEIAHVKKETYQLPTVRHHYAGLIICLSQQEHPDLSSYNDPEIVWRLNNKPYHAGLLIASPNHERVEYLLAHYQERFGHDFLAVGKPKEEVRTTF